MKGAEGSKTNTAPLEKKKCSETGQLVAGHGRCSSWHLVMLVSFVDA